MNRFRSIAIVVFLVAAIGFIFYVARAPISSVPGLLFSPKISYTVIYQNQKIKIQKGNEKNFDAYVDSFHLKNITKLIFPGKPEIPISGIRQIHFVLTSYDVLKNIDFLTRSPSVAGQKQPLNPSRSTVLQGDVSYALEHRYDASTQTLTILLFLSDSMIDSTLASGGKNLEVLVNDLFLLGLYQTAYQLYQPMKYVDFLTSFASIENDLYASQKTFITILQ